MPTSSAGLMLFRVADQGLEVLLVHPGGPFWSNRDAGAWSIPKGEHRADDDAWSTALREFEEELGSPPPDGRTISLGEVRQAGGKRVTAWALEGDLDTTTAHSNRFEMEWPPRSGRVQSFPEVDRVEWFSVGEARDRVLPSQVPFLDRLVSALAE